MSDTELGLIADTTSIGSPNPILGTGGTTFGEWKPIWDAPSVCLEWTPWVTEDFGGQNQLY